MLGQFFKGPEDPGYVVIKVTPKVIEYTEAGAHQPEVYTEHEGMDEAFAERPVHRLSERDRS